MNFAFYIFGTPDGYQQYPNQTNKALFGRFVADRDKECESQFIIYRSQESIYYTYIQKLSNQDDYFGICVIFNGLYCNEPKKLYNFFYNIVREEIYDAGKILKNDQSDNIRFSTNSFSTNKVDFTILETKFRNKIKEQLGNDFVAIDTSQFEKGDDNKKIISQNNNTKYLLDTIKAYQYVIITPKDTEVEYGISKKQKKQYWIRWLIGSVIAFLLMSGFLHWLSSGWPAENIIYCSSALGLGLICGFFVWLKQSLKKAIKFCKRATDKIVQKCKNDPISILGLFTAVGSIFITAFWDVVVQYEKPKESVENLYKNGKYEIKWTDYAKKTNSKDIVFIIDNSLSLKEPSDIPIDSITKLWNNITRTTWLKKTDGNKMGTTKFDVAKYKLMWLLYKLSQESIRGTYAIYNFSNNTSTDIAFNKEITDSTLRKSFNDIYELKNEGKTTNFVELFKSLKEHSPSQPFTSYDECPYLLIFFSDYLHDIDKNSNEQADKDMIIEYIKDLSRKHIFPSLRCFEIDKNPTEIKNKNFSVLKLFSDNTIISNFRYEFTPIENNNFSVFSKLNTENPIKFYYSSYLHSNNLKSTLIFNNGNFEFWLERKNNVDNRQEFHIQTPQCHSFLDNKHISEILRENDTVKVTMNGHIPFQYPFAELVVKDMNKHIEYHSEIVFVRQLPDFLRWVIPLFFGLLMLYVILLFCPQEDK